MHNAASDLQNYVLFLPNACLQNASYLFLNLFVGNIFA